MARKRDRVFSIVVVVLFLVTSLGLSLLVIWQNAHNNTNTSTNTSANSNSTAVVGTKLSNFTPVSAVTTLQSTDLKQGTGQAVKPGASITVYYTGAVASTGVIFQSTSTNGQPASISLGQVIPGWAQGIPGMKVGGTRQLVIPAAEAYGANPPSGSGIPANAPLVFDVTVLSINK
jgi:FKBP-type peptidyl-prolyl cis-trans isomerase